MVVHGINKQGEPEGKRYDNPLASTGIKVSPEQDMGQVKKGGCGLHEGIKGGIGSGKGLPTCAEYELTLAWMWDTQDVKCPPHNR